MADGGNHFIRIMLIYIILADNSRRWSLDAKRRARGSTRLTNTEAQVGTVFLNLSLCLIVAQLCIVYFEAGMYKVQGRLWQEGIAMYYPIGSEAYGVFPWLSEILTTNTWMVVLLTYFTVIVQISFPILLFNRITRRIALISILGVHIAIAMGLPFFSGIMASADAVLVAAATWITIGTWLGNQFRSIGRRFPKFRERIRDEDEPQKSVVPRDPEPIVGSILSTRNQHWSEFGDHANTRLCLAILAGAQSTIHYFLLRIRPHVKYAAGPKKLMNDAAAHPTLEPRTSLAGRLTRSRNATNCKASWTIPKTTIRQRETTEISFQRFF